MVMKMGNKGSLEIKILNWGFFYQLSNCVFFFVKNNTIEKWIVLKLSEKYWWNFPSMILFVIDMMNNVHSLPMILPM